MRLKPRFSLRSLLLGVLTLAAAVTLWRNFDPWRVEHELAAHKEYVDVLHFSPDGQWVSAEVFHANLPSSEARYRAVLWNTQSGRSVEIANDTWNYTPDSSWQVLSRFSGDSRWLVLCAANFKHTSFKLWDLHAQAEGHFAGLSTQELHVATLSTDKRSLACLMRDNVMQLIDLKTEHALTRVPDVDYMIFSYAGDRLGVHCLDGSVRVFESSTGRELHHIPRSADWNFGIIRHVSKETLFVWACPTEHAWDDEDTILQRYDLGTQREYEFLPSRVHSISNDGHYAAIRAGTMLNVYAIRERQIISQMPGADRDEYFVWLRGNSLMFDLANGGLYTTANSRLVYQIPNFNAGRVSPDESRILAELTETSGYRTLLLDTLSGNTLQTFPNQRISYNDFWIFPPDGEQFVTQDTKTSVLRLYRRHRPEQWWGLAWLPEFWITLALVASLAWSLRRDWHDRKSTAISDPRGLA